MDVMDVSKGRWDGFPDWLDSPPAGKATASRESGAAEPAIDPMTPAQIAVMRSWPSSRRNRWGELVELGEAEGVPTTTAKAYAFFAVSNEIEADGGVVPPGQHEDFSGWRPEPEAAPVVAVRGARKRQYQTQNLNLD